jgi:hypothetical protein
MMRIRQVVLLRLMSAEDLSPEPTIVPGAVYEHWKSTPEDPKFYFVIGLAREDETGETKVIYIPLYHSPDHTGPRYQLRTPEVFTELIENAEGEKVPRFKLIEQ